MIRARKLTPAMASALSMMRDRNGVLVRTNLGPGKLNEWWTVAGAGDWQVGHQTVIALTQWRLIEASSTGHKGLVLGYALTDDGEAALTKAPA